ncbi:hypothetical protein BDV93DRAFT_514095 [Ceratobasidium sp. AG-I]|nr:hypothetical protein BDV93DRAFT_514095 [Ceratobasidium sp. AG-I]
MNYKPYPAVADPPLTREEIREQGRERLRWGFAYAVSPFEYVDKEWARDTSATRDPKAVIQRWSDYKKSVLAEAGLHSKSWIPYLLPDGSLVTLLVLGLGFGKVLHYPLRPGIIERVKEVLGTDDEPQWYLFNEESRF